MDKHAIKFLMGLAVGVAAGAAGTMYFESEQGKKTKETVKKMYGDFYSFMQSKIKDIKNMSRKKYEKIVEEAAKEYGKAKNLSEQAIEGLIEKTLVLWNSTMETQTS